MDGEDSSASLGDTVWPANKDTQRPANHHLPLSAWSQNWFSFYLNQNIEIDISQAHRISVPGLLRVFTPKPGRKLTEMEL